MAKKQAKTESRYAKATRNPVVHFEFPMEDEKRIRKFYEKVFGWETIALEGENEGYIIAHSGETTRNGMLREKGIINGGFYKKNKQAAPHPSVVIAVYDLKKAMKKIEKAGGQIIGEPVSIPGYGTSASFYDTEGNRLTILEPTDEWKKKTA